MSLFYLCPKFGGLIFMWMNNYEYDFIQDSIHKKNVANSAKHTRTHCGKSGRVRFPSDNLSKKELKAMSGEVIKYKSLKEPMSWDEFKELPNDLKKEYIVSLRERFGATDTAIAEMLGVSTSRFSLYVKDIGCAKGNGSGNKKWAKEEFLAWRSGAKLDADIPPVSADESLSSSMSDKLVVPAVTVTPVIPASGSMAFHENRMDDILQTVSTLLNCGCGVRYNCTITWECIPPEGEQKCE